MKRLLIVLLSVALCTYLSGQVKNYVYVSGELADASYLYDIENVSSKISGGIGGGLHVGYEVRSGAFILNLGVGAAIGHSIVNVGRLQETLYNMVDDDPIQGGDLFDYVYNQTSRHDSYTNLSFQVPVMLGVAKKHFYFLVGAKFDMSILARANARAMISSEMQYHDYPSPTPMMPNHGAFSDYEIKEKNAKVQFNPQILTSAEIGYRFVVSTTGTGWDVPKEKSYWRLGLFADYGVLDIHKKEDNNNISFPNIYSTGDMQNITINHIFSTKTAAETVVNNLMIGIKATYLFSLPDKRGCIVCKDAYKGRAAGTSSRR